MENPNNFLVNTDYPFDMIVYYKSYELTTNGSSSQTVTIPHDLGFTPLLFGIWSTTPDFEVSWPLSDNYYAMYIWVESDENNIYICKHQDNPVSGKKRYIKIYGFAPTSWTGDCKPTAQSNTALILNTDKIYAPLIAAGAIQPRRMDIQPPEQMSIMGVIGKTGYQEFNGRATTAYLYYQEPVSPSIMLWKTTAQTNRTKMQTYAGFASNGFPIRTVTPYADFTDTGMGTGEKVITITIGATRTGMPTENDIVHFRVYG